VTFKEILANADFKKTIL
jgi:long-chain acyl-CoA synthetase